MWFLPKNEQLTLPFDKMISYGGDEFKKIQSQLKYQLDLLSSTTDPIPDYVPVEHLIVIRQSTNNKVLVRTNEKFGNWLANKYTGDEGIEIPYYANIFDEGMLYASHTLLNFYDIAKPIPNESGGVRPIHLSTVPYTIGFIPHNNVIYCVTYLFIASDVAEYNITGEWVLVDSLTKKNVSSLDTLILDNFVKAD